MAFENDGDPVRGLGFVALNAAYLEEQIDNLLFMLQPVEAFPEDEQRWSVSRKIAKAKRLVTGLAFEYRDALLADLDASKGLFERRNEVIHGRIYAKCSRQNKLTIFWECVLVHSCKKKLHCSQSNRGIAH